MSVKFISLLVFTVYISCSSLFGVVEIERTTSGVIHSIFVWGQKDLRFEKISSEELTQLELLAVNGVNVSKRDLELISGLPKLKELRLGMSGEGVNLEKGSLRTLENANGLEGLSLGVRNLKSSDIGFISKLKKLEELKITRPFNSDLFEIEHGFGVVIASLTKLDSLSIDASGMNDEDAKIIIDACPLKWVDFRLEDSVMSDAVMCGLLGKSELRRVVVTGVTFGKETVNSIPLESEVYELSIRVRSASVDTFKLLAGLKSLRVLNLESAQRIGTEVDLLGGSDSLKIIRIRNCKLGVASLKILKGIESLEKLHLIDSEIEFL